MSDTVTRILLIALLVGLLVGAFQLPRFVVPALDEGEAGEEAVEESVAEVGDGGVVVEGEAGSSRDEDGGGAGLFGGIPIAALGDGAVEVAEEAEQEEEVIEEEDVGEAAWSGEEMGVFLRHLTAGEVDSASEVLEAGVGRIEPGLLLSMGESVARVRLEQEEAERARDEREDALVSDVEGGRGEGAGAIEGEGVAEERGHEAGGAEGEIPETLAVPFALNSAVLGSEGRELVGRAAGLLREDAGLEVEVRGMADRLGDPSYNAVLAQARATAVKDQLLADGVERGRVDSFSMGDTVAAEDDVIGDRASRRVDIVFRRLRAR